MPDVRMRGTISNSGGGGGDGIEYVACEGDPLPSHGRYIVTHDPDCTPNGDYDFKKGDTVSFTFGLPPEMPAQLVYHVSASLKSP